MYLYLFLTHKHNRKHPNTIGHADDLPEHRNIEHIDVDISKGYNQSSE